MANPPPEVRQSAGVPRWAKVQGVFVVLLIVVVIAMSSGLVGLGGHPGAGPAPPAAGRQ